MKLPCRKSPRLRGYDYQTPNGYFVTICTSKRACLFGAPAAPSAFGRIAEEELRCMGERCGDVRIDKYVIMPNHLHFILLLGCGGNAERSKPLPAVSALVGLYKSGVSKRIHALSPKLEVWQKSFYDRVIRSEKEYQAIWRYIDENPLQWREDQYYIETE